MSDSEHTVANRIRSLHVKGFRSLADLQLDDIPNPMVLLSPNGAGKSNILQFFQLLSALAHRGLGAFVQQRGGANDQLFGGHQLTKRIEANVYSRTDLGDHAYSFTLERTDADEFMFTDERYTPWSTDGRTRQDYSEPSVRESGFVLMACDEGGDDLARATVNLLRDVAVYQFHNTSSASPLKREWDTKDNHRLLGHGGNLAPILIHLRRNNLSRYESICKYVQRVLPEFACFELEDHGKTQLRWRTTTTNQMVYAHQTSDGSLRALSLITLLNLPSELLPSAILLDEPELGLHPFAVSLISDMVKAMACERQVIVATQSPYFVDAFGLDELVVLETHDGKTKASRPRASFKDLLDEQTTGELWWSNLLGGYP